MYRINIKVFLGLLCSAWLLQGCSDLTQNIETKLKAAKFALTTSKIGDECGVINKDCSGGLVCDYSYTTSTTGAGTCQQPCTNAGSVGSPCKSNQICSPLTGTCQPSCTTTAANCDFLSGAGRQNANLTCSSNSSTPGFCQLSNCTNLGGSCNETGAQATLVCKSITASVSGAAASQVSMCVPACGNNGSCPAQGKPASSTTGLVCDATGATGCLLNTCTGTGTCSSPANFVCTNGYCEPKPTALCTSNMNCTDKTKPICNISGQCVACTDPTASRLHCTSPLICDKGPDVKQGQCVSKCTANALCSGNYVCGSSGYCVGCTLSSQCPNNGTCNTASGQCSYPCTNTNGLCPNNFPCASGTCSVCTKDTECSTRSKTKTICASDGSGACIEPCSTTNNYCSFPEACDTATGKCTHDCTTSNAVCSGSCNNNMETCETPCTAGSCTSGYVCANGYCMQSGGKPGTITASCGNGVVESGENCDEGAIGGACKSDTDCPNKLHCISNKCTYPTKGFVPTVNGSPAKCTASPYCTGSSCPLTYCPTGQICANGTNCSFLADQFRGNGLSGHCSIDCKFACAVGVYPTGNPNPFVITPSPISGQSFAFTVNAALDLLTNVTANPTTCSPSSLCSPGYTCTTSTTVSTCIPAKLTCPDNTQQGTYFLTSTTSNTNDQTQCPCGLGIWVANGTYSQQSTVPITGSLNVYGGFAGQEISIDDRRDPVIQEPLGMHAFSHTIITGTPNNAFVIGTASTTTTNTVLIDGFQLLKGGDSAILINNSATATLQNLRIVGNNASSGGGIRNLGVMTLQDSVVSLNNATTQGGGISHESTSTTNNSYIERVEFYGNGFANVPSIPASMFPCNAGNTSPICPTGMTCPANGGVCSGTPTCSAATTGASPVAAINCPTGWSCPSAGSGSCTSTMGGAIAATGSATLKIGGSRFNGNYSYWKGGAIFSQSPLNIAASQFTANWASDSGGGIYLSATPPTKTPPTTVVSAAQLLSLTFFDNSAYTHGGGGIYDEGTSSTITNSLFRNNIGLYPINSNSAAEWGGNRVPSGTSLNNQINSISDAVSFSDTNTTGTPSSTSVMTKSFTDMCPIMAYIYSSATCDGSQTCGTAYTDSTCPANNGQNCTFTATCDTSLYVDCLAPVYRNCAYVASGSQQSSRRTGVYTAKQSTSTSGIIYGNNILAGTITWAPYVADILGAANFGHYAGAAQTQCKSSLDCPNGSLCFSNQCASCTPPMGEPEPGYWGLGSCCSSSSLPCWQSACINGQCSECTENNVTSCDATTANNCVAGVCSCGSIGQPCSSPAPYCSNGNCIQCLEVGDCGTKANACQSGSCVCGTSGSACSSQAPYCSNGNCQQCRTQADCGPNADSCTNGKCTCGGNPVCTGSNQKCASGKCYCGTAECPNGSNCIVAPSTYSVANICGCNTPCPSGTVCGKNRYNQNICVPNQCTNPDNLPDGCPCGPGISYECNGSCDLNSGTCQTTETPCGSITDPVTCQKSALGCEWVDGFGCLVKPM